MTSNMTLGLEGRGVNPHLPHVWSGDDFNQLVCSCVWTELNISSLVFVHWT
jgi:hypothetical protein